MENNRFIQLSLLLRTIWRIFRENDMRIRTSLTALGLTAALALAGCAETTSQSSGRSGVSAGR